MRRLVALLAIACGLGLIVVTFAISAILRTEKASACSTAFEG